MAPARNRPFFFLPCQSGSGSSVGGQLNAEARTHIWRQSVLKAEHQPRDLKFVPYLAKAISAPKRSNPTSKPFEGQKEVTGKTQPLDSTGHIAFLPTPISPSPISAGLIDPFGSLAVSELTRDEEFLLHYAFHRILPAFGESDLEKQSFVQSWISRTMASPMVLNAQILGSSTHYLASSSATHSASRIFSRGLRRKIQAIQALRTQIDQYQADSLEVDNDLFLTIFILSNHGGLGHSDWREPHPLSPLATHRDLNVYGRMLLCEEHMNALYYLIEQRGGLSRLDQSIFGYVLPVWDLGNSCRTGSPPRFPCPRQLESMLHSGLWKPDQEATRMHLALGGCFRPGSDGTQPVFLDAKMAKPLLVMVDATVALDHFCRGGQGAPASLDVLLNNCDWATHKILSIAPYTRQDTPRASSDQNSNVGIITFLYEICRLSALLYIDMVIFPTPLNTGIKTRHSKRMVRFIEAVQQGHNPEDPGVTDFLTWAVVLGAIAARFTKARAQYRNQMEILARNSDWDTIHTRLKRTLWFSPVFDGPSATLWLEAQQR